MIENFFNNLKKSLGADYKYNKSKFNAHLDEQVEIINISPIKETHNFTSKDIDINLLSGQNIIEVSENYNIIILTKPHSITEIYKKIQEYKENLRSDPDYKLSILFKNERGNLRLVWLPGENKWLAIDIVYFRGTFQTYIGEYSKYYFQFASDIYENTEKVFDKILFNYFYNQSKSLVSEISYEFKQFIRNSLTPFRDYLEMEKKLYSEEKYRPKCEYKIKFVKDGQNEKYEAYLDLKNPPSALREAGNQIALITNDQKLKRIKAFIDDYDFVNDQIYIEEAEKIKEWPEIGEIYLVGDLVNNARKMDSVRFLESYRDISAIKLVDLIFRPDSLPKVELRELKKTRSEIEDLEFNESQTKAIDLALNTDDICLIHGPPGTGKTTVICEIIYHLLSEGKKVLLVAPTHVAVDNVIKNLKDVPHIFPVRVGRQLRVDPEIKRFFLANKRKKWIDAIPGLSSLEIEEEIENLNELNLIQKQFLKNIRDEDKYFINDLIISQSNLICGTTLGVSRYLKTKNFDFKYDYLIMDESSKESFLNFIVPAVHANKWILVGDHRQLPPYIEDNELKILVKEFINKIYKRKAKRESKKKKKNNSEFVGIKEYEDGSYQFSSDISGSQNKPKIRFSHKSPRNREIEGFSGKIRRFHEEYHALKQSNYKESLWKEIIEFFDNDKELITKMGNFIKFSLGSVFHFLYERLDESRNVKLIYQYRMPEIIAEFLNRRVYNGDLKTKTQIRKKIVMPNYKQYFPKISFPDYLGWFSTENFGNNREKSLKPSFQNIAEANLIFLILYNLTQLNVEKMGFNEKNPFTIGVINYYAKQAKLIREKLQTIPEHVLKKDGRWAFIVVGKPIRIRVSIVDRFQGQEQNIIILSLTRSNEKRGNIGFIKNLQRVNVSLSRAKNYLYIIGNFSFFNKIKEFNAPLLVDFSHYCFKKNCVIKLPDLTRKIPIFKSKKVITKNFKDKYLIFKKDELKKINEKHFRKPIKNKKLIFFKTYKLDNSYIKFDYLDEFLVILEERKFLMINEENLRVNEVLLKKSTKSFHFKIYIRLFYEYSEEERKDLFYFKINLSILPKKPRKSFKIYCPICLKEINNLNDFGSHVRINYFER